MRTLLFAIASAASLLSFAGPHVINAGFTQDRYSRQVAIGYELDAPAVVSLDILTNGVSIGRYAIASLDDGTFHRKVDAGVHSLRWAPYKTLDQTVFPDGSVRVEITAWPTNSPPEWMVLDLLHPGVVRWYAAPEESPWGDFTNNVPCKTDFLVMRRISAGGRHFRMGNIAAASQYPERNTPHLVHFSQDFYLAPFMMTKYQYARLMEDVPVAVEPTDELLAPESGHTYDAIRGGTWPDGDAVGENSLMKRMRDRYGIAFDLPTDAQWEYVCRAGMDTLYYNGCEKGKLSTEARDALGWFSENSSNAPKPVGLKQPNAWGFFDFYGNRFEWCRDWYTADLGAGEEMDPRGPASTGQRLARGGSVSHSVTYSPDYRCNGGDGGIVGIRLWAPAGFN